MKLGMKTPWDEEIALLEAALPLDKFRGLELSHKRAKQEGYRQGYGDAEAKYADLLAAAEAVSEAFPEVAVKDYEGSTFYSPLGCQLTSGFVVSLRVAIAKARVEGQCI